MPAKKTVKKKRTNRQKAYEEDEDLLEETLYRFHHAHLYYVTMTISSVLAIFFLVQGVLYHIDYDMYFAICCYIIAVMFIIIGNSSHKRGKHHYHYHKHLKK